MRHVSAAPTRVTLLDTYSLLAHHAALSTQKSFKVSD